MKVRIGLGIGTHPFEDPRTFFRWVDLCEAGDVDSLWQSDRLISDRPQLEALSVMAALAGATEKMRFGMNAVVVSQRDPLVLAKQCATIDFLSGGRLLPVFGVGQGFAPEWKATGRTPKGRGRLADEALEIMTGLWRGEKVSLEGEFFQYREAQISPLPVQQPFPLWIGGSSQAAIRRTARFGTGWLAGLQPATTIKPVVDAIRAASSEAGRPVPEDHYGVTVPFRLGTWDDPIVGKLGKAFAAASPDVSPENFFAIGSPDDLLKRVAEYRDAGVSKYVFIPLVEGDADFFEQTQRLTEEVLPVAHAWS